MKIQSVGKYAGAVLALGLAGIVTLYGCGKFSNSGSSSSASDSTTDGLTSSQYRIFVTSTSQTGSMGGTAGADAICQARATAAKLTRTYKAIISTETVDALARITAPGEIYVFTSATEKTLVATSATALWSAGTTALSSAVDRDEAYTQVSVGVWTGSTSTATLQTALTCTSWTSTAGNARFGGSNQVNSAWIQNGSALCATSLRLYCISQ